MQSSIFDQTHLVLVSGKLVQYEKSSPGMCERQRGLPIFFKKWKQDFFKEVMANFSFFFVIRDEVNQSSLKVNQGEFLPLQQNVIFFSFQSKENNFSGTGRKREKKNLKEAI